MIKMEKKSYIGVIDYEDYATNGVKENNYVA